VGTRLRVRGQNHGAQRGADQDNTKGDQHVYSARRQWMAMNLGACVEYEAVYDKGCPYRGVRSIVLDLVDTDRPERAR